MSKASADRAAAGDGSMSYHLTREGGHSHRRILHAADATGKAVQLSLQQQVQRHPRIKILPFHHAIDLITSKKLARAGDRVLGAYAWDQQQQVVRTIQAQSVVLATGGASQVYQYTLILMYLQEMALLRLGVQAVGEEYGI